MRVVGWKMLWIFAIGFPRYFLYTLGWKVFLPAGSYGIGRLYQIKIAGELITRATPVHFVGGDTARVLLMGKNLPREVRAGSVIIDRTAMTLGAAIMVLTGLMIGTFILPLPWVVKGLLWILVTLEIWGLLFIISHQQKSAFVSLVKLLDRIHLGGWVKPDWREKLSEIDTEIRSHYEEGHGKMIQAVSLNYSSRLLGALEIFLLMIFLGIPLNFFGAVLCSSISLLLTVAFFVFPGNLGVLEGTYGLLFHWLGLDPATGVTMELLRKVNAVSWNLVGGVIALTFRRVTPPQIEG
jgi:hypothetical protein